MSDVPEGYKMSEVGVIPEEWEVKTLGDCLLRNPEYGINAPAVPYSDNLPTYIRITDISEEGRFLPEKKSSVSNINSNNYFLEKDDIVFARTGASTGKTYLYNSNDGDLVFAGFLIRVKVNPNELIAQYLKSYTETGAYWNWVKIMSMRSGQSGINGNEYAQLRIPLPPLPEQQAIASALSDVDALIAALEQLITKKRSIKQGAMQQLLTGKKRLPGFGGEWEKKKLGSIADITKLAGFEYTKYFNSYKDGGEIIVIRGTNITNNKLDLSDIKTIPRSTSNNLQRSKLQKNDLVFAYVGTIGPVYLIEENDKYHLGPNTARITVNKDISPRFAFCYFTSSSIKNEIIDHTSIGAQPSLSMTKIRNFKIHLPPLPEQQAIAQILSDMDTEIESLEQKWDKYKAIKQGMMQELLTGKTRLV